MVLCHPARAKNRGYSMGAFLHDSFRGSWKGLCAVAAVLALLSACVRPPPTAVPNAVLTDETSLQRLAYQARAQSWYVRVATEESTHEGSVSSATATSMTAGGNLVEFAAIRRIDRRFKRGTGAWTGALIGAAIVGYVAYDLTGYSNCANCGRDLIPVAGGVLLGGSLGMVTGEMLRPGSAEWQTVWRRQ